MKRTVIVLAVLVLLALAQAGQAADLKTGWYVRINGVQIYVPDPITGLPQGFSDALFYQTAPGQYGPFLVSITHAYASCYVSVPVKATGVGSAQSLILPLDMGMGQGQPISYLDMSWDTNYDASQMYLQLWNAHSNGTSELVWSQQKSDPQFGENRLASDTTLDGQYYFRLTVVPEPCGLLVSLFGVSGLVLLKRRG